MAAKISATVVGFTGCAAGPFGPSAPLSDTENADNEAFRSGLVKCCYQASQDAFKDTPVWQMSH